MKKKGERKDNTFLKNSRGQVWIETVIYLLIAFVMMGLVLSYVKPKIENMRDQAIITQSLEMINEIDSIMSTMGSSGNKRVIEMGVKKGDFLIDSTNNKIIFELQTNFRYSEPGQEVYDGKVMVLTGGENQYGKVKLERDFSGEYDIKYSNNDINRVLTKASTSYRLSIENKGVGTSGKLIMDFNVE